MKFYCRILLLTLFLNAAVPFATAASTTPEPTFFTPFTQRIQVSGTVLLVKAYQALVDKNIAALLSVLTTSNSPINQSLTVSIDGKEIRLRLIHIAVLMKEPVMVGLLINLGARPGARDSEGRNAAHYAAFAAGELSKQFGFRPEEDFLLASAMLEFLHSQKVDLNAKDHLLRAPIHYAALTGSPALVSTLAGLNVNLDPLDIFMLTPRQLAVRNNLSLGVSRLLADKGSHSAITWTDIAAGVKNRASSLVYTYPFVVALGIISSAASATFVTHLFRDNALPAGDGNTFSDEDSDSIGVNMAKVDLKLPKAPLILGGGSLLGGSMVLPNLPPAKPVQKTLEKTATSSPLQTPRKKNEQKSELESATTAINVARRSAVSNDIREALRNARDLLARLKGTELDEESIVARRHLVAAINTIAKLKNQPEIVVTEARSLLETYDKYRSKRR